MNLPPLFGRIHAVPTCSSDTARASFNGSDDALSAKEGLPLRSVLDSLLGVSTMKHGGERDLGGLVVNRTAIL